MNEARMIRSEVLHSRRIDFLGPYVAFGTRTGFEPWEAQAELLRRSWLLRAPDESATDHDAEPRVT